MNCIQLPGQQLDVNGPFDLPGAARLNGPFGLLRLRSLVEQDSISIAQRDLTNP
jgi:hypothetical protein